MIYNSLQDFDSHHISNSFSYVILVILVNKSLALAAIAKISAERSSFSINDTKTAEHFPNNFYDSTKVSGERVPNNSLITLSKNNYAY